MENNREFKFVDKQQIIFEDLHILPLHTDLKLNFRFYLVNEISEGKAQEYRLSMANVLANINQNESTMVYILSGTPQGIKLYIGVVGTHLDVNSDATLLKSAFEGNFIGAKLTEIKSDDDAFLNLLEDTKHIGLVTGVPSFNESDQSLEGEDFQSIERLTNTLNDTYWQMIVVAKPGSEEEIRTSLDGVYDFSTHLSELVKHSIQKSENNGTNNSQTQGSSTGKSEGSSTGTSSTKTAGTSNSRSSSSNSSSSSTSSTKGTSNSLAEGQNTGTNKSVSSGESASISKGESRGTALSITKDHIDKRLEHIQNHLTEYQIPRHILGLSKGMFKTAIYLCAENKSTYNRLEGSVRSIFQGSDATLASFCVTKLNSQHICLNNLLEIKTIKIPSPSATQVRSAVIHSTPQKNTEFAGATWLNTQELALLAGLPTEELPGLKLRKNVSFALNTNDENLQENTLKLGKIIQDGRILEKKEVQLAKENLNKHIFVTGVTGAGKTTTCMKLLLESGYPFMVIEPAKTEYRALHGQVDNIQYYSLGREDLTIFRLNPFELISSYQNLTGHVSMLKATLTAVFPMEASMPFIVEQAIINAYEAKGWDIASSMNYFVEDPWNTTESIWPTFSDMISELRGVIKSAGMGREFEEKYEGSLVSRLSALTNGIKGIMINTSHSMDFSKLLDHKVVIELEELKDEEDKAFFMALIIGRIAEAMKYRHREDPEFRHMTLIEEAHRLLSRPAPGSDGSKALGVEMFANLIAEVRKYGESLIIADQIPNKLIPDIIKNTNTKIVHRLFAADDRDTIGESIGLTEEQKGFLPLLQPGETVIYSGGWHAPVRAQIDQLANTNAKEIDESEIAKIGREQLWIQKESLFPQLSAINQITDPILFAKFVKYGREALNILLRVIKSYHTDTIGYTDSKSFNILSARLLTSIKNLEKEMGLDIQILSNMLTALCLDNITLVFSIENREELYRVMHKTITNILEDINLFKSLFIYKRENSSFHECFLSSESSLSQASSI